MDTPDGISLVMRMAIPGGRWSGKVFKNTWNLDSPRLPTRATVKEYYTMAQAISGARFDKITSAGGDMPRRKHQLTQCQQSGLNRVRGPARPFVKSM